jgi:hypothetical protein
VSFLGIKIVWNLILVKIVGGGGRFFLLESLQFLQQSWIIYRHAQAINLYKAFFDMVNIEIQLAVSIFAVWSGLQQ